MQLVSTLSKAAPTHPKICSDGFLVDLRGGKGNRSLRMLQLPRETEMSNRKVLGKAAFPLAFYLFPFKIFKEIYSLK